MRGTFPYFFFGVPDKEIPHKHLTDALNTEDYDEKLKNLIAAYSNIKEQTGLSFDIEKVAKLEARMHNYYFNQKKYNECEILLVELYTLKSGDAAYTHDKQSLAFVPVQVKHAPLQASQDLSFLR